MNKNVHRRSVRNDNDLLVSAAIIATIFWIRISNERAENIDDV